MAAKTYRKIALVTAEQFLPAIGQIPNGVYASVLGDPKSHPLSQWVLDTKEGQHTLRGGDYICTGPAGEQWNVAQEIFEATYEEASPLATPSTDLREENERLKQHIEELQDKASGNCACSYDEPGDVCMSHSPTVKALKERLERVEVELKASDCPAPVIGGDHTVGACVASGHCGCGNRAALAREGK